MRSSKVLLMVVAGTLANASAGAAASQKKGEVRAPKRTLDQWPCVELLTSATSKKAFGAPFIIGGTLSGIGTAVAAIAAVRSRSPSGKIDLNVTKIVGVTSIVQLLVGIVIYQGANDQLTEFSNRCTVRRNEEHAEVVGKPATDPIARNSGG